MPKEVIAATPGGNIVELTWGQGPQVQIATSCPSRLVSHTIPSDISGPPGTPAPEATSEGNPFGGWFADLDRSGINRLIVALRRARNNAYGQDE